MQILNKLQSQYDQLWKYIIRPTRTPYPDSALGPETFTLENIKIKRNSFQLINDRGQVFFGSHFVPLQSSSYPCLIYLHGNSSNQTQGMQYLSELIKNNISLCVFDFSGCGNSEGEYVTLGYNQWRDVEEVVMHVKGKQKVSKIGIWGRSMGAVTALRYAAKNPDIAVAIYDSPFKSLKSLIGDLCKKNSKIPMFILSGALKIIASTIKQKANFDIYELDPLKNEAPIIKVPGFFIVGEEDELIPYEHTKLLFQAYKTKKKQIRIVKGNHNACRPQPCIKDAIKYLKKYLFKTQKNGSKEDIGSGMKIEDVDFFNDEPAEESWKQSSTPTEQTFEKEVDFFSVQSKDQQQFEEFEKFQKQAEKTSDGSTNVLLSSLNEMFAGVFSANQKIKKEKNINDGYDQLRAKISILVPLINLNSTKQEREKDSALQNELKRYDDKFEKMVEFNPSQFVW